jgi:hypothetical protein
MDPFEEFEMRPITEGLGFHKKALKTKKEVKKTEIAKEVLGAETPVVPPMDLLNSITPEVKTSRPIIREPLPRDGWMPSSPELKLDFLEPEPVTEPRPQKTPDPYPSFPKREDFEEKSTVLTPESFLESTLAATLTRRGAADSPPAKSMTASSVAITSLLVDGILVTALSMIFLVALLLVTKSNLEFIVMQFSSDWELQLSMYSLMGFIGVCYFTISRVFCGQSLGEWAFEYQVGSDDEQKESQFPIKILARSALVLATGVIVLPILSLILGKDILAKATGLQLYQKN